MLLIITTIIAVLVAVNFILLKFSATNVPINEKPIDKADPIRREIQLNVQRRLEERPLSYLKVV